ncbi:Holliday junction resolvase RuvX [Patescibacteria group bacterium]|nr:Holliday junction resolvase RuvX [Patescibacteria group bacterium]
MRILGIDYGRKKIGLAFADSKLADPLAVVHGETTEELIEDLKKIIIKNQVEKIVVGISENEMGEESKRFSLSLKEKLKIPVETFDETLTTQEAQKLAIEAGIKRQKRKELEDAYAAALMLQSYLDEKEINV